MLRKYAGKLHRNRHAGRVVVCTRSVVDVIEDVGVAGVIVTRDDAGKILYDLLSQENRDLSLTY